MTGGIAAALGLAVLGVVLPRHGLAPSEAAPAPSWIAAIADRAAAADFPDPAPGPLRFPADHGPHEAVSSESWQVAVHLDGAGGTLDLTVLRLGLDPGGADTAWDVAEAYRAHAVHHPADGPPAAEERFARGFPGLAGAAEGGAGVRVDHWVLEAEADGAFRLEATIGAERAVSLRLVPAKAALEVGTGAEGGPVKGYALTRMEATGTLTTGAGTETVTGVAWLDHAWGALPLPGAGPVAYDRWQVHLEDGREVSLVRTRRTDGRGAAEVDGFVVGTGGGSEALAAGAYAMAPGRTWTNPADGAEWPVGWVLDGPGTRLEIAALREDALLPFALQVWSGPVRVSGRLDGAEVAGRGTMQLTGYGG